MDENFFDFLYPVDYISKISAISHFNYNTKNVSKLWVMYTVFFILLMNILSMYQLNLDITDESNTKLFKFVSFLRFVSPTVSKTSICIIFLLKYETIMHFLDCVNELETVLRKGLKVWLSKKCYLKLQLMVIFFVVFAVSLQIFLTSKTTGLIAGFLQVFNLISLLCQVQFICCVLLLNQYITVINFELSKLGFTKGSSHLKRAPEEYNFNYYGNSQNKSRLVALNSEQTTYLCRELLRFLNIVKDNLNSFYSFPILLIIAENLLLTTFNLYMLIKNMSLDLNSDQFFQQISYLYDVSLNVIQIICIAFPCANTDNEVKLTAACTHQIINQKNLYQESDFTLVIFSKQLLHVEMLYTACGFFTLNENLLTSVFAAISTQLVILLQFQMASTTISTTNSPYTTSSLDESSYFTTVSLD